MKLKTGLAFAVIALVMMACRKKDIQPVIKLNGAKEVTLSLGESYVEAGASAMDNRDGDISDDILISGVVNKNKVGEYRVFYDVEDQEGNQAATAIRFVNVVNDADFMIGTYEATPTCTGTMTAGQYHTSIRTSLTQNNEIIIRRVLFTVEDEPVIGKISGNDIIIPSQEIGDHTVSGSGTIIDNDFILNVTMDGGMTYDCTINHIKQ
ncbi:DUF5011 domain-containing protein [Crocinitomix algicola]|uniref:DUF5011 domain-containing protein n=1 Tax=Crocinitomix algicola TaxID=1740263 RepID=UPI000872D951|nr:DUF5011 domain-containing protein [Crocinitomix algicola]